MLEEYKVKFSHFVRQLQDEITQKMQQLDAELFLDEDLWERTDFVKKPGGGGITRAFEGEVFENAGVNTSEVYGKINPEFASKLKGNGDELWATGISLIIHPYNPKVPTVHANFRMIHQGDKFWFGGGADLTPYYPYEEDFHYFHSVWKKACAPYGCYDEMKKTCDQYFVNTHRNNEMRGIGGLFFDHYNSGDIEKDYKMVTDLANHFIDSYFPLVEKRMNEEYTDEDVEFQLHRRGRYVEFNLLHDRGTLFGLKTKGRIDSILISLPRRCMYTYKYQPKENTPHEKMLEYYKPYEW
ncbi:MAG: oxygen-dependent coproporphyrinogen oxidase [Bacteriovoracaceae bacterium]|jgi:coproporphyrinogen III oxidase|nr:oxygen-dependent coproporphyrinogen oxidase [Bacteriovoracaceae bacterium]